MIILFEENEVLFTNLGLGILSEAKSCKVSGTLNDSFEIELVYPYNGKLYDQLKINRIIFCKPDPYNGMEPFRIYSISKPIKDYVTVKAQHISYDMNGLPVKSISGNGLRDALDKIQNGSIIKHNFKLYTDTSDSKTFKTTNVYNMRALLMGSEGSILEKYNLEIYFRKFNAYITQRVGANRGAHISYAKNLKDITHDINYDRLYNGVYPFYHQETTEETTNTSTDGFKQVYIVGSKPYQDGWLSYTPDGEPYHPIDEAPVQIATEGTYHEKVYCWDTNLQRYIEKVWNEMVTLMDSVGGLLKQEDADTPEWVVIDWSQITSLKLVCKAGEDGYFKMSTDTEWTYHKKGEIVYQGSIKDVVNALILYYAQVIPDSSTSENVETESITHIELDDKIIYIDTPLARNMTVDRILTLDLTSEFEEAPDQDALRQKANEYIEKNKLGQYKFDTNVSFVDLTQTTEGITVENVNHIELGDTVRVTYNSVGIDVELRVVSYNYDAITNKYININLGEKPDKLSADSVQVGDDVSSLTNDVGYTDVTTVNKLVAKIVTADFLKARNAELTKAQIEQLETARIKVTGLIEATQFELDQLVAKLLIADNAVVKETLEAGNIKVKGDINITSGEITIESKNDDGTIITFKVDRAGNVTANSVKITGGDLNINNNFIVTNEGLMTAVEADISGKITALEGNIAGFEIQKGYLEYKHSGNYVRLGTDKIALGIENILTNHRPFEVDNEGNLYAIAGEIAGFKIQNGNLEYSFIVQDEETKNVHLGTDKITLGVLNTQTNHRPFEVDNEGNLYSVQGIIGGFTITSNSIKNGVMSIDDTSHEGVYIGTDGIRLGPNFKVDKQGNVTATGIKWEVSRTITYNTDSQGQVPPSSGWTTNIPSVPQGNYLWSKVDILYIDDTHDYIYSVSRQGEDGTSVAITGSVATYTALLNITGMSAGDGYIVDDASDAPSGVIPSGSPTAGVLFVYDVNNTWIYSGQIRGPQGDPGLTPEIDSNGEWSIGGQSTGVHAQGPEGDTPYIGNNGNWWIGNTDTQVSAQGPDGNTPYIGNNGHWWIDNTDTNIDAQGPQGDPGDTPYIGDNGNWWIGNTDTGVQSTGDPGDTPEIGQDGYWYIGGQSTGVKAEGHDGDTPYIGDNGNWWIGNTDTGVKAEGSDANVTWANVTAVFDTSAQTTKGIYYAQDHEGNLALLLNATAGQIGSFQIYADMLQAGTSGNRVVVSPGTQKSLFGVTKDWSFLAGVTYTEADNVETYIGAKFGVSKDGDVYASSLHLIGGEIHINPANGTYVLDSLSLLSVQYTILTYQGSETSDYPGTTHYIDPENLSYGALPIDINGLMAGTVVPYFESLYDGDYYGYDQYWYVGTMVFNGIEYDKWLHVDANGDESFDSLSQRYFLMTKVVRTNRGFNLSSDGKLVATDAELSGKITALEGNIAGFEINETNISKTTTSNEHVYVGIDAIRLGILSTPSYSKNKGTMWGGTSYIFDLTDATFPILNTVFKLSYSAGLYDKTITITESDDNSTFTPVYKKGTASNVWTIPATSTYILIDNITKKYVKMVVASSTSLSSVVLSVEKLYAFAVSSTGNLSAVNGYLGGFTISENKLSYGNTTSGIEISPTKLKYGTGFEVTSAGVVTADSANLSNVNITSGNITVTDNYNTVSLGPRSGDYYGGISFKRNNYGQIDMGFGYNNSGIVSITKSLNNRFSIVSYYNDVGSGFYTVLDLPSNKPYYESTPYSTSTYAEYEYGISLTSVVGGVSGTIVSLDIGRVSKSKGSTTIYGFDKDACINGQFRNWASEPALGCAGYSTSNSSSGNVSLDTRANQSKTLAMWCARFTVGGDAWVAVPKDFSGHTIRAVVVSRYHGGSLGGYHYGAFYKIENGYVYIGNDDSSTTCDVVIIYEI